MSFKLKSQQTTTTTTTTTTAPLQSGSGSCGGNMSSSPKLLRYLWIRIALVEKHLAAIVDHVVQNSARYYEKDALVSDPVAGQILASLLVGPCALNFTNVKSQDQYWTDPPADELVQRHRISSLATSTSTAGHATGLPHHSTPPSGRKPLRLTYKKTGTFAANFSNGEEDFATNGSPIMRSSTICWSPKEYVESLHQNAKSTLLYGKNNVITQPVSIVVVRCGNVNVTSKLERRHGADAWLLVAASRLLWSEHQVDTEQADQWTWQSGFDRHLGRFHLGIVRK